MICAWEVPTGVVGGFIPAVALGDFEHGAQTTIESALAEAARSRSEWAASCRGRILPVVFEPAGTLRRVVEAAEEAFVDLARRERAAAAADEPVLELDGGDMTAYTASGTSGLRDR